MVENLNDETLIGEFPWIALRDEAMNDKKYKESVWYHPLSEEQKGVLETLRWAQKMQGNMGPLNGSNVVCASDEQKEKWRGAIADEWVINTDMVEDLTFDCLDSINWMGSVRETRAVPGLQSRQIIYCSTKNSAQIVVFAKETGLILTSFDISSATCLQVFACIKQRVG